MTEQLLLFLLMDWNCASLPSPFFAHLSHGGFDRLHVIPGSSALLRRISLGEDNLLLFYKDDRVRLWDMKTLEFWRSMDVTKAEELVAEGGWFDLWV